MNKTTSALSRKFGSPGRRSATGTEAAWCASRCADVTGTTGPGRHSRRTPGRSRGGVTESSPPEASEQAGPLNGGSSCQGPFDSSAVRGMRRWRMARGVLDAAEVDEVAAQVMAVRGGVFFEDGEGVEVRQAVLGAVLVGAQAGQGMEDPVVPVAGVGLTRITWIASFPGRAGPGAARARKPSWGRGPRVGWPAGMPRSPLHVATLLQQSREPLYGVPGVIGPRSRPQFVEPASGRGCPIPRWPRGHRTGGPGRSGAPGRPLTPVPTRPAATPAPQAVCGHPCLAVAAPAQSTVHRRGPRT